MSWEVAFQSLVAADDLDRRVDTGRQRYIGLTKYECAKLAGALAQELERGRTPNVPTPPGTLSHPFNALEVAGRELRAGVVSVKLMRTSVQGQTWEVDVAREQRDLQEWLNMPPIPDEAGEEGEAGPR